MLNRRCLVILLPILCLFTLATVPPGCTSSDEVNQHRAALTSERDAAARDSEQAKALQDANAADRAAIAAALDRLNELQRGGTDVSEQIAAANATREKLAQQARDLDTLRAARDANVRELEARIIQVDAIANRDVSATAGGIGTMVDLVVPGLGAIATAFGAIALRAINRNRAITATATETIAKARALRSGFERVVASVNAIAEVSPELATAWEKHAESIKAIQGPDTKALVKRVKAGVPALDLPGDDLTITTPVITTQPAPGITS